MRISDWSSDVCSSDLLPKLRSVTLDDPGFRDCMHAALTVIQGLQRDPTDGSTHYIAWRSIPPPAWTKHSESTGRIATHDFYRHAPSPSQCYRKSAFYGQSVSVLLNLCGCLFIQ